jgi:hypothetical protein
MHTPGIRDEKGTWCLGVYLGQPDIGGHKYKDLVFQVGGWNARLTNYYAL